jgi:hypothetical protein
MPYAQVRGAGGSVGVVAAGAVITCWLVVSLYCVSFLPPYCGVIFSPGDLQFRNDTGGSSSAYLQRCWMDSIRHMTKLEFGLC